MFVRTIQDSSQDHRNLRKLAEWNDKKKGHRPIRGEARYARTNVENFSPSDSYNIIS